MKVIVLAIILLTFLTSTYAVDYKKYFESFMKDYGEYLIRGLLAFIAFLPFIFSTAILGRKRGDTYRKVGFFLSLIIAAVVFLAIPNSYVISIGNFILNNITFVLIMFGVFLFIILLTKIAKHEEPSDKIKEKGERLKYEVKQKELELEDLRFKESMRKYEEEKKRGEEERRRSEEERRRFGEKRREEEKKGKELGEKKKEDLWSTFEEIRRKKNK